MSNDRAIEALADALAEDFIDKISAVPVHPEDVRDALASAGLQITDQEDVFTEDELKYLSGMPGQHTVPFSTAWRPDELARSISAKARRRLSGATDATF